ncbi:hypothetical protein M9Y10_039012 [Tritrichomonas musculus]|uniref:Uncharacterized protein n=1 Tax=Tritrichomonas musculus TaxID=1915356 RepID=A0ABR2KAQ3_9EUKA
MLNSSASVQQSSLLNCSKYVRSMNVAKYNSIAHKQSVLSDLRQNARNLSKEFPIFGLKSFFEHWGDRIYDHGMKITDPNELDKFTTSVREDINDIHNHVDDWSHKEVIHLSNSSKEYIE